MTGDGWALAASVVFAALWSGLLAMLTFVMHPILGAMNGRELARFLRAFLPTARRAPFNYVEVIGMVVAPIVALVALVDDPGGGAFVLTAIGLTFTIAGPLLGPWLSWTKTAGRTTHRRPPGRLALSF